MLFFIQINKITQNYPLTIGSFDVNTRPNLQISRWHFHSFFRAALEVITLHTLKYELKTCEI